MLRIARGIYQILVELTLDFYGEAIQTWAAAFRKNFQQSSLMKREK